MDIVPFLDKETGSDWLGMIFKFKLPGFMPSSLTPLHYCTQILSPHLPALVRHLCWVLELPAPSILAKADLSQKPSWALIQQLHADPGEIQISKVERKPRDNRAGPLHGLQP